MGEPDRLTVLSVRRPWGANAIPVHEHREPTAADIVQHLLAAPEPVRREAVLGMTPPGVADFLNDATAEAAHQSAKWGTDSDAGKSDADWFWLVGYLAGKALHAFARGDRDKGLHHLITTAAALANWHAHARGVGLMRPGIADP